MFHNYLMRIVSLVIIIVCFSGCTGLGLPDLQTTTESTAKDTDPVNQKSAIKDANTTENEPATQSQLIPSKVAKVPFFTTKTNPSDAIKPTKTLNEIFKGKEKVALSVFIAEIAKAEKLSVTLDLNMPDQVITIKDFDQNTPAFYTLQRVAKDNDFYINIIDKSVRIYKTYLYELRVPPVGIVNDKKITAGNYTFWKTLFDKKGFKVQGITDKGIATFIATPSQIAIVKAMLNNYQLNGEIMDFQVSYVTLSSPLESILPSVAALPATEIETGRSVRILTTKGKPDELVNLLGKKIISNDNYHALLFLGDVNHSICDRGIRMAAKRQTRKILYDMALTDLSDSCKQVGPILQTESNLGDTIIISISTGNAFIIYPERITFNKTVK